MGDTSCITYKGPKLDTTTKTRRELEVPLPPGEQFATEYDQLFEALGFHRVAMVSKVRQKFQLCREGLAIELAVDQVEHVGDFVELEIVVQDEADIDHAQRQISTLASELQLENVERKSYLELLLGMTAR